LTLLERFNKKYRVNQETGCWDWIAAVWMQGRYGAFWVDKEFNNQRMTGAHRASYFIHTGVHPKSSEVCHSCDNTLCVNPEHLFLGSHTENMRDMVLKGRHRIGGQKMDTQKKTLGQILKKKGWEVKQIAKVLGISSSQCSRALRDFYQYKGQ
jgi:transcriptional regulator with GAF, ATPase, and Fis domain